MVARAGPHTPLEGAGEAIHWTFLLRGAYLQGADGCDEPHACGYAHAYARHDHGAQLLGPQVSSRAQPH